MNYFGIKGNRVCFYLKIPPYFRKRLEFYEFIIHIFDVFIGINWSWHTGRGLIIYTKWFLFKWAWSGIADDYKLSKSKFQFLLKGK